MRNHKDRDIWDDVLFWTALCIFVSALFFFFFCHPANGQWAGGVCLPAGPVGPILQPMQIQPLQPIQIQPEYQWQKHAEDDVWVILWQGNRQVGAYNRGTDLYFPLVSHAPTKWGYEADPPIPVPVEFRTFAKLQSPPLGDPLNFGIDPEKLGKNTGYKLNGKECSKRQAYEMIEKKSLVDDSKKLRLTVIGTEKECQTVMLDLAKQPLADLTKDMVVRDYRPDHWHVDGVFEKGSPAIYCQLADGQVLARLNSYPGPELFATVLRKTSPNYDPKKDPNLDDLTKPKPQPQPQPVPPTPSNPDDTPKLDKIKIDFGQVPGVVWLGLGAGVVYLISRFKGTKS